MKFITVDGDRVQLIHYMPFDPKDGLGKTAEELQEIGYLVEDIPEPVPQEGKIEELHYTAEKGFWYEYVDAPNPYGIPEETYNQIKQAIEQEIAQNAQAETAEPAGAAE